MPKLRRLSGKETITILERFDFVVIRIKGSHHRLRRTVEDKNQYLTVPVHGSKPLAASTLRSIYRQACAHIPEKELRPHFYAH
jgi:predicted RNA binding protein YcfA (HicA-like mRNA interferase family)